ncbi:hypothetical protein [Cellulophaga sp. E6(2014)]|uniref:hypothetical protein n=1 Tax=Cellulophaga sp. E6(2014) TaxID=1495334 RepID=UPI00051D50F5|nr:hypothetical protein [Cellulophaga sp. E6(2014)]KGK28704.1 hypothetical protein EL45_19395 [Cellulophaga sp. E6(2014)]
MKQILTLIILIFLLNPTYGQKNLDIPENKVIESFMKSLPKKIEKLKLQDLRTSEDSLNIRIWQTHNVFTINQNSDSTFSDYKIFTTNKELVFKSFNFKENISQKIMDSLSVETIMNLKDENYRGIDGSFIFLEISTGSIYKVVSYWSPSSERSNDCEAVVEILSVINNTIDSKKLSNDFLNSLPSGSYRWGMTSVRIDRFLDKAVAKTDFYSRAEKKIEKELSITDKTNHWDYPLILVNNKPAMLSDLNKYNDKEIAKFEVLKPDNNLIALYGTNGSNGVVLIETK